MHGLVLILDLWSGIGGLIFSALALGIRCVVLSAEADPDLRAAKAKIFPNLVEIDQVEQVNADILRRVIGRRDFSAILVGGGSPCQGNSFLNTRRRGLADERSQQPRFLRDLADELKTEFPEIPVFTFLENVASSPADVIDEYSTLFETPPLMIDAANWGWTRRRRLFWLSGPLGGPVALGAVPPEGFELDICAHPPTLTKVDGKPWPAQLRFGGGFDVIFDKNAVCQGTADPLHTFSREFPHPTDRVSKVSEGARNRFLQDDRRFPPSAYEEHSLLWFQGRWRQPSPNERAAIMGVPAAALQAITPDRPQSDRIAKLNSVIGNGFHIPSVMLALFILFQLGEGTRVTMVPAPLGDVHLQLLNARVRGTIFDDYLVERSPGIRSATEIFQDMMAMFEPMALPTGVVQECIENLQDICLAPFQAYWVYLRYRGHTEEEAPPVWAAQRQRGLACAALGHQRAAGNTSKGIDHLLPPGLGRDQHIQAALEMSGPFSNDIPLDPDMEFAIDAVATFGPFVHAWRDRRLLLLQDLRRALEPLERALGAHRSAPAVAVAADRPVAFMAFVTALLRWPDRAQPAAYLTGFRVVGEIEPTGVFRGIPGTDVTSINEDFFGDPAVQALDEIIASRPPKDHALILAETELEISKGFCGPLKTARQLNGEMGVGKWRPIHRFVVHQGDKHRLIDDGRRGEQNMWSSMAETILTIGVDFPAQVGGALLRRLSAINENVAMPIFDFDAMCDLHLSIADLPDAFRGLPVAVQDQRATVVAIYVEKLQGWRFTVMQGCPFGLGSVVVNFNRYPALLVATARRMLGLLHGAYFDDNVLIEPALLSGTGHRCLLELLHLFGTPPKPSKTFDASSQRVFLGASVSFVQTAADRAVVIAPRESTRTQVQLDLEAAIETQHLSSAQAAKVRGRSGWLASNSVGRVGRLGHAVLKRLQYSEHRGRLSPADVEALAFHLHVVQHVPPRRIQTWPVQAQRPLVMYSDAEYTPGQLPRIGFVLFLDPPHKPVGATLVLPQALIDTWQARKTQIYPAEAIAVPIALAIFARHTRGRDVTAFCDNAAAVSTLIRGSSTSGDVLKMAEVTTLLCLDLHTRLWVDWVDSESNPADGLSRLGLADDWTRAQGWICREIQAQALDLSGGPFDACARLQHWALRA